LRHDETLGLAGIGKSEYQGLIEHARQEKGANVLNSITQTDFKVTNGVFGKHYYDSAFMVISRKKEFIVTLEIYAPD
jgi:hypothetical protein